MQLARNAPRSNGPPNTSASPGASHSLAHTTDIGICIRFSTTGGGSREVWCSYWTINRRCVRMSVGSRKVIPGRRGGDLQLTTLGEKMSDPWVLATQNWLNGTYGMRAGFNRVTADGTTGWQTVNALVRALQIELGIASLSDTFGPTTLSTLQAYGELGPRAEPSAPAAATKYHNIVKIIQGALYCKGYDGGGNGSLNTLDGVFGAVVSASVKQVRQNMGLSAGTGNVDAKTFKALLNMDAFVLVSGGSAVVRTIQQSLNARYIARRDFFVIPADGFFSRSVQNALLLALQYEIGMADGTANGNFGPGTQSGLRTLALLTPGATDSTKYFVHLFQAAMAFNGYPVGFDGVYGPNVRAGVAAFQSFVALPSNGNVDFQTWASLLVSTGDTSRPGTAVDCITTITPERAQTLVANGYKTVGRYLTNTPGGTLDKNIKPGELATIFAAGLSVFPIHQEGGTGLSFFNYDKGYEAGLRAADAARDHGFKAGTTIYFAVDFDALEDQVIGNIVPHFRGVNAAVAARGGKYKVGIYGARNTCKVVSDQGLATLSFVSGMSTGFSGNLGYPLPPNWAFDQILEYSIGSGAGAIGIDKNIQSGADRGQTSIDSSLANISFFDSLRWLEGKATQWVQAHAGSKSAAVLVTEALRVPTYAGPDWVVVAGEPDPAWIDFVSTSAAAERVALPRSYRNLESGQVEDSAHLFASIGVYLVRGVPVSKAAASNGDFGGWAGDLITAAVDFHDRRGVNGLPANGYDFGRVWIGSDKKDSSFDRTDLSQDVEAYNIANAFRGNPGLGLASHVLNAIQKLSGNKAPYGSFYNVRFGGNLATAQQAARRTLLGPFDLESDVIDLGRAALWFKGGVNYSSFAIGDLEGLANAFIDVVRERGAVID